MGRNQPGWEGERTLAAAEADDEAEGAASCACGSDSFVLEAYHEVRGGKLAPEPVEVEALTCPHCGREYEAVLLGEGRVQRGAFLGFFEDGEE